MSHVEELSGKINHFMLLISVYIYALNICKQDQLDVEIFICMCCKHSCVYSVCEFFWNGKKVIKEKLSTIF